MLATGAHVAEIATRGTLGLGGPQSLGVGPGPWEFSLGASSFGLGSVVPANWCRDVRAFLPSPSGSRTPVGVRYTLQAHPGKHRRLSPLLPRLQPNSQTANEEKDLESAPRARLEIAGARLPVRPRHSTHDWDSTNAGATTG